MSATLEPKIVSRSTEGGINLVALARPYFGLIVLTTALLTAFGMVSMLRMPSGIYPEVAFPRIVVIAQSPGLAVKDVEVAVTRPIEEAVSIVLGVIRVRSKSVRGAAELSIDFAPGTDMIQALNDVRARMAEVGAQLPPGTTSITERQTPSVFPIISFVVTGGRDPSALHDYAYYDLRPRISRIPRRVVRHGAGGRHPGDPGRGRSAGAGRRRALDRRRGRSPGQGAPAQGRRAARSRGVAIPGAGRHPGHRPPGPGEPGHRRQERPADPAPRLGPGDDLARGPDDGDPGQRQRRRGADRLPPPGRQRLERLARSESGAGRRRQIGPARRDASARSTTRDCWSARPSPTCATRSSSAVCSAWSSS